MPDFLAETRYQNIASNTKTPFQKAFITELPFFDWMVQHPEHFAALQKVMAALEGAEWTDGFSLIEMEAKKVLQTPPQPHERPCFVDVRGGHGHKCVQWGRSIPISWNASFFRICPGQ